MASIECSGFTFYNDFCSANLAKVSLVPPNESPVTVSNNGSKSVPEIPDAEFNLWTKPDCHGTEFENANRTWFYFGVKAPSPGLLVRFNIVNLNRQGKMYSQGMAPVYRVIPGKLLWERIRDKPAYNTTADIFTLSFKFKCPENPQSVTYFAFTYPFSYADLQKMLQNIDEKFENYKATSEDDIYYTNEVICHSLGGRDVNLLTVSSYHGMMTEPEVRLKHLFPNKNVQRPNKFLGKKIIFVSARVHPGETPSTFVFNGLLNLLLTRDDPIAIVLRRLYVFKMIPFLNPDGVSLGHYRTDMRGVNLNRVYLNPSLSEHPPVYAARQLIRYYHFGCEKDDFVDKAVQVCGELSEDGIQNDNNVISSKVSHMTLEENHADSLWCMKCKSYVIPVDDETSLPPTEERENRCNNNKKFARDSGNLCKSCKKLGFCESRVEIDNKGVENSNESRLFLYIDMHGHASKKGIFMYGNHFDDIEKSVECMLLPKILSLNNHNFHFTACNFTERNMYLKDRRDGMSREGSGRVAVHKITGLVKSYTLECNYNTGRIVNVLPPTIKEPHGKVHTIAIPPKYTPQVFEEVGKSIGASILDLTGQNPCTRIPNSEFHNLTNLQDWLRINCIKEFEEPKSTIPAKLKFKNIAGLHNQAKSHGLKSKAKSLVKHKARPKTVPVERKENIVGIAAPQPGCSYSGGVKSALRLNRPLSLKAKPKKDFHKFKPTISSDKPKPRMGRIKKSSEKKAKLRELCVTKDTSGAKEVEDCEVFIAWKPSGSQGGKIKSQSASNLIPSKVNSEVGSSKSAGGFRVPNFAKNSNFSKFKKHTLRRATNAPDNGKIEKNKGRKKIKPK